MQCTHLLLLAQRQPLERRLGLDLYECLAVHIFYGGKEVVLELPPFRAVLRQEFPIPVWGQGSVDHPVVAHVRERLQDAVERADFCVDGADGRVVIPRSCGAARCGAVRCGAVRCGAAYWRRLTWEHGPLFANRINEHLAVLGDLLKGCIALRMRDPV